MAGALISIQLRFMTGGGELHTTPHEQPLIRGLSHPRNTPLASQHTHRDIYIHRFTPTYLYLPPASLLLWTNKLIIILFFQCSFTGLVRTGYF